MPHQKLHKAHVSLVITNYQLKGLSNIKKNLPCQFSLIPCRTVKLMLRRGWMKRAESLLDLERIEFPFTWWYTQSVSKNKMEQQTPIPPPNQGWSRAKAKTRHFSILDLGGDGGGGLDFPSVLSNNVASGKPLSRKILLLSAQLKSSLQFPFPRRSFFFCIQVVYAHSSIQAPVKSNKLNNKYERFGWWNYPRRNF